MCGKNLVRLNQQLQCILMYLVDLVDPVDLDNKIAEFTVLVRKTFQSNKIRFDYQRIIFQGKSWSQISQMLTVRLWEMTIPLLDLDEI